MKRSVIFISLLLILAGNLFAKTWFVCAGSFSKFENAEDRCAVLNDAGYDCFIETAIKADGTKIYRVLFLDDVMIRDDARNHRDVLVKSDVIVKNGWTDLWICEADMPAEGAKNVYKSNVPVAVPAEEPEPVPAEEIPEVVPVVIVPEIPGVSASVLECVSQFPVNPLYVLEDFAIADYVNYDTNPFNVLYGSNEYLETFLDYEELTAGAYIKMVNAMTDKEIEMAVVMADDGLSEDFIGEEIIYYWDDDELVSEKDFTLNYGKIISAVTKDESGHYVCGVSEDSKMAVYISAEDFSEAELMEFMNSSFKDTSAVTYKELLKTFLKPVPTVSDK